MNEFLFLPGGFVRFDEIAGAVSTSSGVTRISLRCGGSLDFPVPLSSLVEILDPGEPASPEGSKPKLDFIPEVAQAVSEIKHGKETLWAVDDGNRSRPSIARFIDATPYAAGRACSELCRLGVIVDSTRNFDHCYQVTELGARVLKWTPRT